MEEERANWNVRGMLIQGITTAMGTYLIAWALGSPGLFAASAAAGAVIALTFRGR